MEHWCASRIHGDIVGSGTLAWPLICNGMVYGITHHCQIILFVYAGDDSNGHVERAQQPGRCPKLPRHGKTPNKWLPGRSAARLCLTPLSYTLSSAVERHQQELAL